MYFKIDQIQSFGLSFKSNKEYLGHFLAATYVVKGSMTLGMLLSISYIIGQMNSAVSQTDQFFLFTSGCQIKFRTTK